jgi:sucrose-6-phosphate hydrolase SacC (GH32 family)
LRILVDRTSLEVFAQDGKVSMSSCFVPKPREQNLECFARGGTARIIALDVRPLRSAVFPPSLEKP